MRADQIIAILVERLGGEVTITDAELRGADFDIEVSQDPAQFAWRCRAQRRPAIPVADGTLGHVRRRALGA